MLSDFTSVSEHLRTNHGLTVEAYRKDFSLVDCLAPGADDSEDIGVIVQNEETDEDAWMKYDNRFSLCPEEGSTSVKEEVKEEVARAEVKMVTFSQQAETQEVDGTVAIIAAQLQTPPVNE